jgi:hypothetical protein
MLARCRAARAMRVSVIECAAERRALTLHCRTRPWLSRMDAVRTQAQRSLFRRRTKKYFMYMQLAAGPQQWGEVHSMPQDW